MKKTINIKWPLIGNDHIFKFLDKQIREKNPAQVYIFSGISNVGKTKTATHFAKSLLCLQEPQEVPCDQCLSCLNITRERNNHSDLYYLKREDDKKNISIEQVRDFIHKISLSSFQNGFKIGIIKNAHYLNINGHNALLKTLEEPNKKVVIILTTSNIDQIPNTVLSRSQVLRFRPVDQNLINNL
ncbi:MAG: AAA family ATPase, partial [Candidatus Falkowbacteria bacterium]|nr:AAA family ATPase [Candidatus Falkowbacteria bacterium]